VTYTNQLNMSFLSAITKTNNILDKYFKKINEATLKQEDTRQKTDLQALIAAITIVLPLSAFLYWRIFLNNFNRDYFSFCYSAEDVAYILYEKGTYMWYLTLMLSLVSWLFLIRSTSKKLISGLVLIICSEVILYTLAKIGGFSIGQIILFMALLFIINLFIFFYNRNAFYGYIILFGLYLINSADIDAKEARNHPKKETVVLRTGKVVADKNDNSKLYIGTTSKFVLIYDKTEKQLIKFSRDSVR